MNPEARIRAKVARKVFQNFQRANLALAFGEAGWSGYESSGPLAGGFVKVADFDRVRGVMVATVEGSVGPDDERTTSSPDLRLDGVELLLLLPFRVRAESGVPGNDAAPMVWETGVVGREGRGAGGRIAFEESVGELEPELVGVDGEISALTSVVAVIDLTGAPGAVVAVPATIAAAAPTTADVFSQESTDDNESDLCICRSFVGTIARCSSRAAEVEEDCGEEVVATGATDCGTVVVA